MLNHRRPHLFLSGGQLGFGCCLLMLFQLLTWNGSHADRGFGGTKNIRVCFPSWKLWTIDSFRFNSYLGGHWWSLPFWYPEVLTNNVRSEDTFGLHLHRESWEVLLRSVRGLVTQNWERLRYDWHGPNEFKYCPCAEFIMFGGSESTSNLPNMSMAFGVAMSPPPLHRCELLTILPEKG
jgi:hypothetical protein